MNNRKAPEPTRAEKRQTRFIFTCIGNILYIIPCLSCLFLGVASDGWSNAFLIALITIGLALPAALFAMHAFKVKKLRGLVILADAVMLALHLVSALLVGSWYLVMAPAFFLFVLNIVWSDVIVNR